MKLLHKIRGKLGLTNQRHEFYTLGFHGDKYLLEVVDHFIRDCEYFIETGSNVGTSLHYTAKKFPKISALSCEPDVTAYNEAVKNTRKLSNIKLYNCLSQDFLEILKNEHSNTFGEKTFFWLDAHGYGFQWPLREEIAFITENYNDPVILIDDFLVPNLEEFGYDIYQDQICSHEYIKGSFVNTNFNIIYPNYSEHTSNHHPLRGWGLYIKDINKEIPNNLKAVVKAF